MKKKTARRWIITAIIAVGGILCFMFAYFHKAYVIQAYKMPSGSMQPTLLIGDQFFVDKSVKKLMQIKRGDIIIFAFPPDPSKDFIKRVIGLPGERIEIKDKAVYINGDLLEESYVIHTEEQKFPARINPRDNFGPIKVSENALFVLGDNRDASNDSRYWGLVTESKLKGRATTIYWSWDKDGFHVRWDRIGRRVH